VRMIARLPRLLMLAALGLCLGAGKPQDPASAKNLEGYRALGGWFRRRKTVRYYPTTR
jgi:hypothetical protein